jgi:DNA repair protein RecO (recombination protein O)
VDVLDKISVECQVEDRLFDLAVTTLGVLQTAQADELPALVVAFLLKSMAMHGYRPQFGRCAVCGSDVPPAEDRFSLDAGGPLCESCDAPSREVLRVTAGSRAALSALMRATMAEVGALGIPRDVVADAFRVMRAYVGYHVPARLKALDLYAAAVAEASR